MTFLCQCLKEHQGVLVKEHVQVLSLGATVIIGKARFTVLAIRGDVVTLQIDSLDEVYEVYPLETEDASFN